MVALTVAQRAVLEAMVKPNERSGTPPNNHMPTRFRRPWVCGSDDVAVSWNTIRALVKRGYIEKITGRGQCGEEGCHAITSAGRAAIPPPPATP